jgi:hypothetical protein
VGGGPDRRRQHSRLPQAALRVLQRIRRVFEETLPDRMHRRHGCLMQGAGSYVQHVPHLPGWKRRVRVGLLCLPCVVLQDLLPPGRGGAGKSCGREGHDAASAAG